LRALLHDADEKFTGDTPAPFKRMLRGMGILEENLGVSFLKENGIPHYEINKGEEKILKIADYLDLCFKCKDEIELGNTKVYGILKNGLSYLEEIQCPESIKENVQDCLSYLMQVQPMKDR
jgi:5'-deoxynucleotidase YfbR-like HD superfamily hydrolase